MGPDGDDTIDGLGGNDTINGFYGADTLYGGAGNDVIDAGFNPDLVYGGAGNDTIYAGNGHDRIYGGEGDDQLLAGRGNDRLEGGAGRDVYTGGLGADVFVFRDGDFAGMTATTSDKINDFRQADGDKVRLDLVDANTLAGGDQAFDFVGTNGFSSTAGELRYEIAGGNTYVYGDTNGDGGADFMIRLVGSHTLTLGDFVL